MEGKRLKGMRSSRVAQRLDGVLHTGVAALAQLKLEQVAGGVGEGTW